MNHSAVAAISQLLPQVPVLLVFALGLILAIVNWRRLPTPCLLVTVACALSMLLIACHPVVTFLIIQAREDRGWTSQQMTTAFTVVGAVSGLFHTVAIGALLAAVFLKRKTPAAT